MGSQGALFWGCRKLIRLYMGEYRAPEAERMPSPAVYICRHHNIKGPLLSLAYSNIPLRPWVYSVFCARANCYRQLRDYTYSVRFGWGKLRVKLLSALTATPFSALVRSCGAIPVYRKSLKLRDTLRLTVDALERGESIIIFPDVDYTASEADTGALYEGFLAIDRLYERATKSHVRFVPLHVSDGNRVLAIGDSIRFKPGVPYIEDKSRVLSELHASLNKLSDEYGE